ncbi:hypothetical protein PQX77_020184 [Marasmius sp. AFHP31]|nr:hypothetical protein PQX77_020184 [Marasmius sp. AFHP31]
MLNIALKLYASFQTGCPLAKWLNQVLHPPTVVVEEVAILVPTRTSALLPSRSVDVPIVTQGYDKLWPLGLGLLVLVLLSSSALLSRKMWGRRGLGLLFAIPGLSVTYHSPALLESLTSRSLDIIVFSSNVLDWFVLPFPDVAEWVSTRAMTSPCLVSPTTAVGTLVQNTARMGELIVFCMGLVASAVNIVKSLATISLYIAQGHLVFVVSAVKALHTIPLPTVVQAFAVVNASWTLFMFLSCIKTVVEEFMSFLPTRKAALSDSLAQLSESVWIAVIDATRILGLLLLFHLQLLGKFLLNVTIELALYAFVFTFCKREDKMPLLKELFPVVVPLYRLYQFIRTSVPIVYESHVAFLFRPFTYEVTLSVPNWKQLKAAEIRRFRFERVFWDDSACLNREEFGEFSKGGWYERTWKLGHAWLTLFVIVAPKVGSDAAILLP